MNDKTQYFPIVMVFLTFSLILHAVVYFGMRQINYVAIEDPEVELEIIYQDLARHKKRVVIDPNPDSNEQLLERLKEQAKYLSRLNRRVKKEVIASRTGQTKNRQSGATLSTPPRQQPVKKRPKYTSSLSKLKPQLQSDLKLPQVQRFETSPLPSTISEVIPNVEKAGFTALNTNAYTYYSFFRRLNSGIYSPWTNQVNRFLQRLTPAVLREAARTKRTSIIEVTLDNKGFFEKAIVLKSSGIKDLDEAAITAFKRARVFNNPPQALADEDGKFRLNYSFYVSFDPSLIATH